MSIGNLNESQLATLCAALGWQGGTFWQALDEVRKLKVAAEQEPCSTSPETPAQIAAYLRDLSRRMLICGTAMDYCGGFDDNMAARGLEMIGAARMAHDWAQEIEAA